MILAKQLVAHLLEADETDAGVDPEFWQDFKRHALGAPVTPENAQTASVFYHRKLKYADGKRPLQVRRNGKTKTWKTRPGEFRIPVKYGMYDCFYIDNRNAHEWSVLPPAL